jgi:hypothetical protein
VSVSLDGNSVAAIIAACGSIATAFISSLNRRTATTTESKVDNVHSEVVTSNGNTLGALVEQNLSLTLDKSPAPKRVDDGTAAGAQPLAGSETPGV